MTSLCRHLSVVSTGNCKLGHDCRRVCSHRRRDSFISSALAVCIGLYGALQIVVFIVMCTVAAGSAVSGEVSECFGTMLQKRGST